MRLSAHGFVELRRLVLSRTRPFLTRSANLLPIFGGSEVTWLDTFVRHSRDKTLAAGNLEEAVRRKLERVTRYHGIHEGKNAAVIFFISLLLKVARSNVTRFAKFATRCKKLPTVGVSYDSCSRV